MPEGPVDSVASRFAGAAELPRSVDGAAPWLCWAAEPADGPSRPIPVPCALANPVPAINAAVAAVIIKRFIIEYLLTCFYARVDNESGCAMFPDGSRFPQF